MPLAPLPHSTRQVVFSALFALLKTTPNQVGMEWNTFSQHLKIWDDVGEDSQPALFLFRGPQLAEQKHVFGATRWLWKASIWIYYRINSLQCAGNDEFPEQMVDAVLDVIEQVFQTEPLVGRLT